jgi:hypothetical protein
LEENPNNIQNGMTTTTIIANTNDNSLPKAPLREYTSLQRPIVARED